MGEFLLRLLEDRCEANARVTSPLPPLHRVCYVVQGSAQVMADGAQTTVRENEAWYGSGAVTVSCATQGAHLLRWELAALMVGDDGRVSGDGVFSTAKLSARVMLEPGGEYLMRCDRVDFPPGGVAYLHTHQGPGIRCLLTGEITVSVNGASTTIGPLGAWFEAGPDPVYAAASRIAPTSFARVMILPRALKGTSSIRYVNPEDRDKPKPQHYTVYVDEPIRVTGGQ